jgi:hypothetical protein
MLGEQGLLPLLVQGFRKAARDSVCAATTEPPMLLRAQTHRQAPQPRVGLLPKAAHGAKAQILQGLKRTLNTAQCNAARTAAQSGESNARYEASAAVPLLAHEVPPPRQHNRCQACLHELGCLVSGDVAQASVIQGADSHGVRVMRVLRLSHKCDRLACRHRVGLEAGRQQP